MDFKIAIEHLEPVYSLWLIYEYINASRFQRGGIAYTNIGNPRVRRILSRYGYVYKERIGDIVDKERLIILDPNAEKDIEYNEIGDKILVIGGILGDNPPRGRTEKLLWSRYRGAIRRRMGIGQMSIDSSVYVASKILEGYSLNDIDFIEGLTIETDLDVIILPYRYPLENGEPIISPVIRKIIQFIGLFHEYWLRTIE